MLLKLEHKILRSLHQRFSSVSHCPFTGNAEFYFFTLSTATWTRTGNFLLFTFAIKRKDGQKNSHTWKKPTMEFKMDFYCFEYLREALLQIPSQYTANSLSVHSYFTYFHGRQPLDVPVSAMTQSKYCAKPCRLNSSDLLWKHLRSFWAAEELKICPGRCRWSWLTQDYTLDYSCRVDHEKWQPANTLPIFNWEDVWFNTLWRRWKSLHLIPSREEQISQKKFKKKEISFPTFAVESRAFFPSWVKNE